MILRCLGVLALLAPIWVDVVAGPDGGVRLERPQRLEPVKVELQWDAPKTGTPDVVSYEVYRAVEVATTTGTCLAMDRVLTARPYWYAVRAVGRNGLRSGWSEWICVDPP